MTTSWAPENHVLSRSTETARISRLPGGVVLFEPEKGARIGRDQAMENNRVISEVAGDAPVLLIAWINSVVQMDRQAREYSARYADQHYQKVALVARSATSRMLASFFVGFNKPVVPSEMFADVASARAWLLEGD